MTRGAVLFSCAVRFEQGGNSDNVGVTFSSSRTAAACDTTGMTLTSLVALNKFLRLEQSCSNKDITLFRRSYEYIHFLFFSL